ncbi:hypothetical protein H8356DRAFT_1327570, partial [Neocallimastix lanati (nom. inval.)]
MEKKIKSLIDSIVFKRTPSQKLITNANLRTVLTVTIMSVLDNNETKKLIKSEEEVFTEYGGWLQGINVWVKDFICPCRYILLGVVDILLNCNLSDIYAIAKLYCTGFKGKEALREKAYKKILSNLWLFSRKFLPIWKYCDYLNIPTKGVTYMIKHGTNI